MALFIVVSFAIILINILIIGIFYSKITLNIEDCNLYSNNGLKDIVSVYLFKIIKIINIRFYKTYFKIFGFKIYYNKIFKFKKENFKKLINFIKLSIGNNRIKLDNLNAEIDSFYMNLNICSENAAVTSIVVSFISFLTAIILNKFTKKYNPQKHYYKVNPIYLNTNGFKFSLKTKIDFTTMNILIFVYDYILVSKKRKNIKTKKRIYKEKFMYKV
jgi:hypothetical protein